MLATLAAAPVMTRLGRVVDRYDAGRIVTVLTVMLALGAALLALATQVWVLVLASAAGPGVAGTLIDVRAGYPAQIAALGAYCLLSTFVVLGDVFADECFGVDLDGRLPEA